MGSCSRLATTLDNEHLADGSVSPSASIAARQTSPASLPQKTGAEVKNELGGRFLLRYLLPTQLGAFNSGSSRQHFVTPTPYSPDESSSWLALPQPQAKRTYVMILDPEQIDVIRGPRWVRFGDGIEYLLPNGFGDAALVLKWPMKVT